MHEQHRNTGHAEEDIITPYYGVAVESPNLQQPTRESFSTKDQEKLAKIDAVEASLDALSTGLEHAKFFNSGITESASRIAGQTAEQNANQKDGSLIIQHNALVSPSVPHGGRVTVYNSLVDKAHRALDGNQGGAPYWQHVVHGQTAALGSELSRSIGQVNDSPKEVLGRERLELEDDQSISAEQIMESMQKKVDEVIARTNSDTPAKLGESLQDWASTFLNDPNSIPDGRAKQKILAINDAANKAEEWGGGLSEIYDEIGVLIGHMDILLASAKAKIYHNKLGDGPFRRAVKDPYLRP